MQIHAPISTVRQGRKEKGLYEIFIPCRISLDTSYTSIRVIFVITVWTFSQGIEIYESIYFFFHPTKITQSRHEYILRCCLEVGNKI